MSATLFDATPCTLGEGPFWHPERTSLFWFDIIGRRLMSRAPGDWEARTWDFAEHVSAAGHIDRDRLFVASETGLFTFDLESGSQHRVAAFGTGPGVRSNDGRADPWGGFWIGTMGKRAEPGAGAIWRWHLGELRRLFAPLTIPNAIAFAPDRSHASFADTLVSRVWRVPLDAESGWPAGEPEPFLDLAREDRNPDGAVYDAEGLLWIAEWGGARVVAYAPDGTRGREIAFPAPHTACPAFGGPHLDTLYCTTAREHLPEADLARHPLSGATFAVLGVTRGLAANRVVA